MQTLRIVSTLRVPDGCSGRDVLNSLAESNDGSEFLANAEFEVFEDAEPVVPVEMATLTVTVKGPREVLDGYAGRVGGEDMADLFYGIGDAGIAEIVSSVISEG